jgi:hypothetical protein
VGREVKGSPKVGGIGVLEVEAVEEHLRARA